MTRKNRNRKNKRRRKTRRMRGGASDQYIKFGDDGTFKINEISGSMIDFQYQLDKVGGKGDGNCLFRSLAAGILKDQERYEDIRKTACDEELKAIQKTPPLADEPNLYVCSSGEWGREPEIQAMSSAYKYNIIVFQKIKDHQYDKYEYKYKGKGEGETKTVYLHLDGNHYDLLEKSDKIPDVVKPTEVALNAKTENELTTKITSVLEERRKKGFRKITDVDQFYKTGVKLQGQKHPNKPNEQMVFDVITKGPFFPTMIEHAMNDTRKMDVALDAVFKQITGKTVYKPDPNKTMWFGYKT
jgi:hypothetical protein